MRRIGVLALALTIAFPLRAGDDRPMLGFTPERTTEQRKREAAFDAKLNAENLRAWMKRIAARPHHAGSPYGREVAEFIAAQFQSWGYETAIEEFRVLLPTPKKRHVELLEPAKFVASLEEPALAEDATSDQKSEQLPTYNAYSIDGDVTGELVYVNYGVPKDYDVLAENGIDVKGKIVIARYGGSWRGIKPKVAAERGAIGCLIYSDPRDDGYFHGDVYPHGSWRNERGVQRGSVADMPLYPGDPLTPGVGATKDAKRLATKDAPTLTKIPVLPISYSDALPLLRALGGPIAPENWRGALPITYHLGPGPAKVRLHVEFDWKLVPAYDVIARITGSERPDEWIMRGNHHDAWVNGADDPTSGMVAMMEEARGIAELVKAGWRPKRTIVYAAWDAEEQGLLGSTEWAETHAAELKKKLAVYINTDSNGRGFVWAGGSHTLEKLFNEVAHDVVDPQKNISVAQRLRALRRLDGNKDARERNDLRIAALGSGSDYTPFIQHLGIASMHVGYGGEDGGGSYHSIYDSFDHYTRFGDPGFQYGIALAKTTGRLVMRLADADVLPFEFTNFAETVGKYVDELKKLANDMREETEEKNKRIDEGIFAAVSDPTKPYVVPKRDVEVPHLNFAPLENAVARLVKSAAAYKPNANANPILLKAERALTLDAGLPRRSWFKHQIYAPGFYTGYGVKTIPGVREAIEQRNWKEAEEQIVVAARAIERFAVEVERATSATK